MAIYIITKPYKFIGGGVSQASVVIAELLDFFIENNLIAESIEEYNNDKSKAFYDSASDTLTLPNFEDSSNPLIPQIRYRVDNDIIPTGTIISFMGTIAPTGYLFCDGTVYNIANYTNLAEFINTQFGSYDFFGGDGETTFAVPDLRGEFLRGTGTNSHTNQGNGANVGVHQDGTEHIKTQIWCEDYSSMWVGVFANTIMTETNVDKELYNPVPLSFWRPSDKNVSATSFPYTRPNFTSRPTNTSIMYCIKY